MTITMRRTAIRDGTVGGVPEEFVVGALASTATMVVALVVELVFPATGPWALLILLADPVFVPLIRRIRGDRTEPPTGAA
jgi:1,4-dihydroxy-2-naphthoate octaprenyltransferase